MTRSTRPSSDAAAPSTLSSVCDWSRLSIPAPRYQDVVRHVAPRLYGHDPAALDEAARAVIEHHDTVPLVGASAARGRAYVAASVLDAELRVAETADRLSHRADAVMSLDVITDAVTATEHALGRPLSDSQRNAVTGIATSGRGLDLVVGVSGAGKTTALDVLRTAYESGGYRVLGTATSGQASRALTSEANVEALTIA